MVKKELYIRHGSQIESIAKLWKGSVLQEDTDKILVRVEEYIHKRIPDFVYEIWIFKENVKNV